MQPYRRTLVRAGTQARRGRSPLLPLPNPYIVPGGRFDEVYYWDSYFTMLGLEESGRREMVLSMVRNFASLIDRYGHVPNGNRTYYLSRSQPPYFAAMVELVADRSRDRGAVYAEFLEPLSKEYAFWMAGADTLAPSNAYRRVVRLRDGTLFNRYRDDRDIPRDEAYHEDVETAKASGRPPEEGPGREAEVTRYAHHSRGLRSAGRAVGVALYLCLSGCLSGLTDLPPLFFTVREGRQAVRNAGNLQLFISMTGMSIMSLALSPN